MKVLSDCVNCGGEIKYVPESEMLRCERCGSVFNITIENNESLKRTYTQNYFPNQSNVENNKFLCETCGSKIISGKNTNVSRCASCGNPTLKKIEENLYTPDGIIPFKISKQKAGDIFYKWVSSRKFAPSDLKQMAKLKKISGIYSPVWNMNFKSILKYDAIGVKINMDSDGNEEKSLHNINKIKEKNYTNVVISGNSRINDYILEGLGEYNFENVKPFSNDYLLGFSGLDTNVDLHTEYNQLKTNISNENQTKTKNNLLDDYDKLDSFICRTRFSNEWFNYAYVPVWANHYTYKGKEYHCYINGATGKATGKAPKSFFKIMGLVFGIVLGIGAIIGIISKFI